MSVYVLAQLKIKDMDKCKEYQAMFPEVFRNSGGRLLVADTSAAVLEGEWANDQVVLMQFDNQDQVEKFMQTPKFQELAKIRSAAVEAVTLLIKGL